jgi:hypothetical protein
MDRPAIPESVKRQLRIEACYGCCRCGEPFIQFHHILGVQQTGDDPKHMMALCPNCHSIATANAMPIKKQYILKKHPHNCAVGSVHGRLWVNQPVLVIQAGWNVLVGPGPKIVVDGEPILALEISEEGELLVSLRLYDADGTLALWIDRNEWIAGPPNMKDFVPKPRWLRIRLPHTQAVIMIDARKPVLQLRGSFKYRGTGFNIGTQMLTLSSQYSFAGMAMYDGCFFLRSDDGSMVLKHPSGSGSVGMQGLANITELQDTETIARYYAEWRQSVDAERKNPTP